MSFFGRHEIRPGVRRLLRFVSRRPERVRAEADEEIGLHLTLRTQQLIREGLSPAEARAEAERRFGAPGEARRQFHDSAQRREERMQMREWLDTVRQDVRLATRGLLRAPVFTATAVICLALGIGANAATYSLFDQLLLRPLPVPEPERLVYFASAGPRHGRDNWTAAGDGDQLFSYPMYRDVARSRPAIVELAGHRIFYANFAYHGQTQFGLGVLVTGSYFNVLRLKPALGRLLGPADDETPGAHPIVVLGHGYWTSELGADSSVIGKAIVVNGRSVTIVGVAPRGFEGTTLGAEPRVFAPLAMAADLEPGFGSRDAFDDRKWYWLYAFGRLKPGVSIERARTELNTAFAAMMVEVEAPIQKGMSAQTLERFKGRRITVVDGRRGQSRLHGQTRAPLLLLFAITGLVVLIASANVANLLLARGAMRSAEMAVRLSLGAGRRRLLAQLLTESLLLAVVGGAASLAVARGILALISALIPPLEFGAGGELPIALNQSATLFAAAVALGTGLLFGLFPALNTTRPDLVSSLKAGSGKHSSTRAASRFRMSLVTAQIALSMTLLIAAGLFILSLRNVSRVALGVNAEHVVQFAIAPMFNGYEPTRSHALFARVEEEMAATPGVANVAASGVALFTGSTRGSDVQVEGFPAGPDTDQNSRTNLIGPGYFRTLGIPLLSGREFTLADRQGAPKVAIVNEAFARKFGLGREAVGRRMAFGVSSSDALDVEIVGLVRDTRYNSVKDAEPPIYYVPYRQDPEIGGIFFYVRTVSAPEPIFRAVRRVVAQLDPNLPVVGLKTLPEQVRESVYLDRMIGTLSAGFAALATLLAAVGLYGVLAYTVAQRTREIGVRMALGADAWRVRRMVLGEVGRMTLIGAVLGVGAALALGRIAQTLLFGLSSADVRVVSASTVVLALVALVAGYVPARRASRVAPMRALRAD
jgi:predicted permease